MVVTVHRELAWMLSVDGVCVDAGVMAENVEYLVTVVLLLPR